MLVKLVAKEFEKNKALENPGAGKLLESWDGAKSGLPFFVVLDAKGERIADSNRMPGGKNIAWPASPEEIEAFDKFLQDTAPLMTAEQRAKIGEELLSLNKLPRNGTTP